jgi:excisionase family DNA binding protein
MPNLSTGKQNTSTVVSELQPAQRLDPLGSRLYTIAEVADLLSVHQHTVRRWIAAGSLTACRAGRSWRVPEEAVRDLLAT